MRNEFYSCDICGKAKSGTGPAWIMAVAMVDDVGGIRYWPWDEAMTEHANVIHLCSAACAAKHLTQWIEKKTW